MTPTATAIDAFLNHFRGDLFPIYLGLAGVCGWLGLLTGLVYLEVGAPADSMRRVMWLSMLLAGVFGVLLPIGTPAAAVAGQWWRGEL